jgi:3-hexulose-6-phosphate synthase
MLRIKQLQLAIDTTNTADAVRIAEEIYPYYDIAEIGTMLLIEEGLYALEAVRQKYPDKKYLADTKIVDAGYIEASSAFRRGADIVTVLGFSDDVTIAGAVKAARQYKGQIMADTLHVGDKAKRSKELEELGVDIICLHTAWDLRGQGIDPLAELAAVRQSIGCSLAIAGGLTLENAKDALDKGADILVVGGGITKAEDPRETAKKIKTIIGQI